MTYSFERNGDEFSFAWPAEQIGIGLEQIYEYHGEIYAEIWVQSSLATQSGHIHWGRLNLSASQTRDRLAATLASRVKEIDKDAWTQMLEAACTKTVLEFRKGEPVINLAKASRPTGSPYLIHRMMPLNVTTILFGDGGTAKSLFALYLGMAVQGGLKLPFGLTVMKQTNVLYLDWEWDQDEHVERLHAIANGLEFQAIPEILYRKVRRPLHEEVGRIRADVAKMKIGMVIIDSLGFASGGDLRENGVALGAMDALGKLGVTSLAIAHITKEAAKESGAKATPFGSAFFSFAARSTWEVRKAEENADGELNLGMFQRKANRGALQKTPIGVTISYDEQDEDERLERITFSPFSLAEDDGLAQHASVSYRLREALKKANGEPLSINALAESIGAKEKTISRTLDRMPDALNLTKARGSGNKGLWVLKSNQIAMGDLA